MKDLETLGDAGASRLRADPELQSALVRILTSVLGGLYIALGAWTSYYRIDLGYFLTVFGLHLVFSLALLASVWRRPDWPARRSVALCLDVIVVSLAISVTQDAISPFYLLYILIFISSGTRFGRDHLILAAVVAVIAYNAVLIQLDEWRHHPYEAAFFLLLLVLLPWYQASLLRQLQQARLDAERANKAKGDFLAVMTHELRTPLTGVIGMTDLLADTQLDAVQRDYVAAIGHSANVLNALIGDILDFSKIEAGRVGLERIPFDPHALAQEVCEILAAGALAKGLELICRVEPEVPSRLEGDPLRVRQILFNLLGNAIKFTERGEVCARLSLSPPAGTLRRPHLVMEVLDSGIGIPREKLVILFESFRQADDSTTRRFGGTGLGTTIARELAVLMGGSIEVESEEGVGSCFRVRLPLLAEDDPALRPVADGRLRGLSILVVEANARQRAWIRDSLAREGAACQALAGIAGLATLAPDAPRPDLALLADRPAGDDLSVGVERLRARLGDGLLCLLLTYPGRRPEACPSGVACLTKPLLADALVGAVLSSLGQSPSPSAGARGDSAVAGSKVEGAARSTLAGLRVLVAEDNEIAAKVVTGFLSRFGVEHRRFRDGEAALAAARSGDYQIAILDLHMPKLDGFGFVSRLRAERPDLRLPVLALTANASEEQKRACLEAGMDAFLSKPVRPDDLKRALESLRPEP
ncbi:ATP-binding protein [Thiocystis violacea]|uniref:ATP-binding protein n=1 Tax=Thiocystis violacea TaxID=13725 RepID=UPI001F5B0614|nr:ATP-binding protein [Thiocystis violacea]